MLNNSAVVQYHAMLVEDRALKACGRRIGRRVYYLAVEVARIISGAGDA